MLCPHSVHSTLLFAGTEKSGDCGDSLADRIGSKSVDTSLSMFVSEFDWLQPEQSPLSIVGQHVNKTVWPHAHITNAA